MYLACMTLTIYLKHKKVNGANTSLTKISIVNEVFVNQISEI
jgi:hypothetical protein